MPDFAIRHLSVLSYAKGFTAWHYHHHGPLNEAVAKGFLNPAADMIAAGDTVMISAQDGGALMFVHRSKEDHGVYLEPMAMTDPESRK